MKAWMRVSTTGAVRDGPSLDMFLRGSNAYLLMDSMWGTSDRDESGTPQVGDWREGADGAAVQGRTGSPTFWGLGGPNQDSVFLLLRCDWGGGDVMHGR